jgi:hypothetical protein
MVEAAQSIRCSRPECEVSKTGVCPEGHTPIESCPFWDVGSEMDHEDIEDEDNAESPGFQQSIEQSRVALPSGEALTPAEIDQFLLWKAARFVTIVGEFDSGKTTLICALYDRFLRGSYAGYLFSGSRTLVGLEKKSHHARIDSGRLAPDTLRTSLSDGLQFFHLSLVSGCAMRLRIELMISDRAGEQYQKARNNSNIVPELVELKMAQHIVLLMDGGRVADPVHRSSAMQTVRQTLQAFLDSGALSEHSRVQVVTTKVDLLSAVKDKPALETRLEQFRIGLRKDFDDRLGELTFWEIAARDPHGTLQPAHGLEQLLASWCTAVPISLSRAQLQISLETEFDRLLLRTPMGEIM